MSSTKQLQIVTDESVQKDTDKIGQKDEQVKTLFDSEVAPLSQQPSTSLVIPVQKESGWTLVFLVSMTLGVVIFGFGLKSIVGYTLNRKNISTQTLTPDQMEELYSELRSAVLLLLIGILLIVMMLFTGYKTVTSFL